MGRSSNAVLAANLIANPYPAAKDHQAINTICELCDRTIKTKDWSAHKRSKKHRENEKKENEAGEGAKQAIDANANGFTDNFNGTNGQEWGNDTSVWASSSGDPTDGFGNGGLDSGYGNKASSGGPGACYGCGQVGHNKRDCPSTGAPRGCFNCGDQG